MGGGSGALSIALARANPELECVIWDIPAVCPIADEYVRAAGCEGRVTVAALSAPEATTLSGDYAGLSRTLRALPPGASARDS